MEKKFNSILTGLTVCLWFFGMAIGTWIIKQHFIDWELYKQIDTVEQIQESIVMINKSRIYEGYFQSLWMVLGFFLWLLIDYRINNYFKSKISIMLFIIYPLAILIVSFLVYLKMDNMIVFGLSFLVCFYTFIVGNINEKVIHRK